MGTIRNRMVIVHHFNRNMFKLKLHFCFFISEYYIAAAKYHARKFHWNNDRVQKWVERTNKLLLEDN